MKSERRDLLLTIATLVRSATPVVPLEAPPVRLTRWVVSSAALVLSSVVILGARADAAAQMMNGWFVARAMVTLAIMVAAALVAFLLSVPGITPSRVVRALPLAASLVWAVMLVGTIATTQSPLDLLLVTPHLSCILLIAAAALSPAVIFLRMLQHAAPLQAVWTIASAALASLAAGALGAQFVCTDDAAAHHLVWHFTPVVLLSVATTAVGSLLLRRPPRVEYLKGYGGSG